MKGFRCQVLSRAGSGAHDETNRRKSPHQWARRSRKVERTGEAPAVEDGESPTMKLTIGTNRQPGKDRPSAIKRKRPRCERGLGNNPQPVERKRIVNTSIHPLPMTDRPPIVNGLPLPVPKTAAGRAALAKTLAERQANGFDAPLRIGPLATVAANVLTFMDLGVSVELADRMEGIVDQFGVEAVERYLASVKAADGGTDDY